MSRLLKIIGLFCKRALEKRLYSAKETYNLKEPTHRSHPIAMSVTVANIQCGTLPSTRTRLLLWLMLELNMALLL